MNNKPSRVQAVDLHKVLVSGPGKIRVTAQRNRVVLEFDRSTGDVVMEPWFARTLANALIQKANEVETLMAGRPPGRPLLDVLAELDDKERGRGKGA